MEASSNANPLKTCIVGKFTPGWSEAQPLVSKQSLNRHLLPVEALVTSTTQDVSDTPLIGDDKIGVLLLNLGGPETLDDVQPFLFNLFADPVILFSSQYSYDMSKLFFHN
jgi:ferrochelatase